MATVVSLAEKNARKNKRSLVEARGLEPVRRSSRRVPLDDAE
jgi:hypothetical protein